MRNFADDIIRSVYDKNKIECIICTLSHFLPLDLVRYLSKIYADIYWGQIQILKEKYNREANGFFETYKDKSYKLNLKSYATMVSFVDRHREGLCTFTFPIPFISKYVYKNLRIKSLDQSMVQYCELTCGGHKIETIYGQIFPTLRYMYGITNTNILPFSFCKKNEYLIGGNFDITLDCLIDKQYLMNENFSFYDYKLVVDVYEIIDEDYNPNPNINIFTQVQFMQSESPILYPIEPKLKNIINYIIVHLKEGKLIKFYLLINGVDIDANIIHYGDQYIVPFAKFNEYGINFSEIHSHKINIQSDCENTVSMYAISYNGLVTTPDYCGVSFSG